MATVSIAIPENYGGVLMGSLTITLFVTLVGFGLGGVKRKQAFT